MSRIVAEARRRETLDKLARFRAVPTPRIALIDISVRPVADIARRYRIDRDEIAVYDDPAAALESRPDLLLALLRGIPAEEHFLFAAQRLDPPPLVVGWTWDNHHTMHQRFREVLHCDVILPSHWYCAKELATPFSPIGPHVPLSTIQWTAGQIGPLFAQLGAMERSDALTGGFNDWGARAHFLRRVMVAMPDAKLTIHDDASWQAYRGQSAAERFQDWAGYKTSLCVPVHADLSNRVFDALAAGQVPLIVGPCYDLQRVFPGAAQERLPIVHERERTVEAVRRGHAAAIARFDAEGAAGALRRHRWVAGRHLLEHRLAGILDLLRRPDVAIDVHDDGQRLHGRIRWAIGRPAGQS